MQGSYQLRNVDELFIKGSKILGKISKDERKVECLHSLSSNWELVLWIQESFKSNH